MKSPVEVGFDGRYKIKNVFTSAGMHLVFPMISAQSPTFQLPTLTALSRPGSCLIGCGGLDAASLAFFGFSSADFSDVDSSGLRAEVISEPHPSIPKKTAANSAASQPERIFVILSMQIPLANGFSGIACQFKNPGKNQISLSKQVEAEIQLSSSRLIKLTTWPTTKTKR